MLKPGGRVLAVDFAMPVQRRTGLLPRMHFHGDMTLGDIVELLRAAGLHVVESGTVGILDLQFALATVPTAPHMSDVAPRTPVYRSLDPFPTPRWIWPALAIALVAAHGLVLRDAPSRLTLTAVALVGATGLLVAMHSALAGVIHALLRRHRRRRVR